MPANELVCGENWIFSCTHTHARARRASQSNSRNVELKWRWCRRNSISPNLIGWQQTNQKKCSLLMVLLLRFAICAIGTPFRFTLHTFRSIYACTVHISSHFFVISAFFFILSQNKQSSSSTSLSTLCSNPFAAIHSLLHFDEDSVHKIFARSFWQFSPFHLMISSNQPRTTQKLPSFSDLAC